MSKAKKEVRLGRAGEVPRTNAPMPKSRAEARPTVRVSSDIRQMRLAAEAHLLASPEIEIYQSNASPGELVSIARSSARNSPGDHASAGGPVIVPVSRAVLREFMSTAMTWLREDASGKEVPTLPPQPVVDAMLASGSWPFPVLAGIVQVPSLRPDGTVLDSPGYDARTGLYFAPARGVSFAPQAASPTHDEALSALEALREVIVDFPFESPHDESAALAAMLTPLARGAFEGCVPLFCVDATTPGSGKGLLVDCCALLATGRSAPRVAPTANDEMEKRITACLRALTPILLIDNVDRPFGGSAVDAMLTAPTWLGRFLGSSSMSEMPNRMLCFITGNNIRLLGDTPRRSIRIRLAPPTERPAERASFRHRRLLPWLERERGRLVAAALTVVRAYICAGRPAVAEGTMGSFEGWADLVRATLVWLEQPDPLRAWHEAQAVCGDDEVLSMRVVLRSLFTLRGESGFAVREVIEDLERGGRPVDAGATESTRLELREALASLVPESSESRLDARRLGRVFANYRGRPMDGLKLVPDVLGSARLGARWCVTELNHGESP
ncbi:MAG: hypothetical protein H6746_17165 [Deltaproteobacteria bacterium]|nr:hypothetical protein [Deltaproteobacteria bacterium]